MKTFGCFVLAVMAIIGFVTLPVYPLIHEAASHFGPEWLGDEAIDLSCTMAATIQLILSSVCFIGVIAIRDIYRA